MKKIFLYGFIFMSLFGVINAQTYTLGGNATGSIANACGGTFYDSGGPGGDYAIGENDSVTFCAPAGQYISFTFTSFSTEEFFDFLNVYDGPTSGSPLISSYNGSTTVPTIYSSLGGCITFVFSSDDFSDGDIGWAANIGCSATPPPPPPPGTACSSANPFCTDLAGGYTFPNSTGNTGGIGPKDCLGSTPNPVWYFMQIQSAGNVTINIAQTDAGGAALDVDFDCWGPFTDISTGCAAIHAGTASTVDCSYSASNTETCNIPSAMAGQYYALLLTNFSDSPGTITFGSDPSSTGSTNCNIINCGVTATNTGPYCVGETISLNAATTNTTATTYSWSGPGGFTATGASVTILGSTLAMSGTYSVTGTTGGTVTCVATTTVTVATATPPTVTSTTICAGSPGTLTASGTATSYTWNTGTTTATMTASPVTTTVYSVIGSVGSCTAAATGTITVITSTTVTPTVTSTTICAGSTGTVTAAGMTSYTWSTGAISASMTDNPANTTIYGVVGSIGTCTAAATGTITVVPNPTLTPISPSTICNGNAITLSTSGATTYSWSPAGGLSTTTASVVTANPISNTTYTITGTVGTCSATPITVAVAVVAATTPTVTSNTPCANQTLSLTCTPAYTNYVWAGPSGFSSTIQNPIITNVTAAAAGTYTLLVTDANGCINATTGNAIINPLPVVTGSATPACVGFPINLSSTPGFAAYSWSSSTGFASTAQSPTIAIASLANQGFYHVLVTDINGCQGTNAIPIQVIVNQPPTIKLSNIAICVLTTGTLTASGAVNYSWFPTADLSTNFGNPVLVTPSAVGATIYTVTGTDANGCVNTATAVVGVNDLPAVSIAPTLTTGCTPVCATYTASGSTGIAYNWSFGNGQGSTVASPTECSTAAGNYVVKLTLTDANLCKNTATASVITYPIPDANFYYTPDPVSILEPTVTFFNSTQGLNIIQYLWDFGDTLNTSFDTSSITPQHTYLNVGSYPVTLIAVSANGCSDTMVKNIIIEQDFVLYVPNSFTPNGDGKNEIFKAQGEGITDFKMYIFDRWGNKVFTTYDINIGWDGRINDRGGESLSDDVYVWKIDLKSVDHQGKTYTGTVTMIK